MADAFLGFQQPETIGSDYNALVSIIKSILSTVHTSILVEVIACTNNGGLSAVGTVDVRPMVNQIDGYGNMVEHDVIYKIPYQRIQGGANAIIIDPEPGDIGSAIFADRDISTVISTKHQSNPGSNRRFDMADGCYLGGFLNAEPTQYIQFSSTGIKIFSPMSIIVQATNDVSVIAGRDASITASRDITATATRDIIASASRNISATASGDITANATGNITATAMGSLSVTATNNASVTGNTVTVNASGGATINGDTEIDGNLLVTGTITGAGITIT